MFRRRRRPPSQLKRRTEVIKRQKQIHTKTDGNSLNFFNIFSVNSSSCTWFCQFASCWSCHRSPRLYSPEIKPRAANRKVKNHMIYAKCSVSLAGGGGGREDVKGYEGISLKRILESW